MSTRADCLQQARQASADSWPALVSLVREHGTEGAARLIYSPDRHPAGLEALEARIRAATETRRAA